MIVDGCAGPGGWSEGLRRLGLADIGIEWDWAACLTRRAAGHVTIQADVSQYPPERFAGAAGCIFSPPCPAFSGAGEKGGYGDLPALCTHVHASATGWRQPTVEWCHLDSALVLEPLRWVWAIRPEWVALEQVPGVLPVWRAMASTLGCWGYSTWVGVLNAADYGVPQARRRAVLMASRSRRVSPPTPTHSDQRRSSGLFDRPWVTMAEALGLSEGWRLDRRQNGALVLDPADAPAPTLTSAAIGKTVWTLHDPSGRRVPLTMADGLAIQDFPTGYPLAGSRPSRGQQIGNAVPPGLAAAIVGALTPRRITPSEHGP